jgi:hypothetical protein
MTLRPIDFRAGGSVLIQHDDPGHTHTFTVNLADLKHPVGPLGEDTQTIIIECPLDGWSTAWPVLGGEGGLAQQLFIERAVAKGETFAAAKARVQAQLDAAQHPRREQLRTARTITELRERVRVEREGTRESAP